MITWLLVLFLAGLIFGSFATALSYRIPRGINWKTERSECTKCHKKLKWYDNIPLLSYLFLWGKCRFCREKISCRYPLIEVFSGLIFVATYLAFYFSDSTLLSLFRNELGFMGLIFTLIVFFLCYLILIIDWENKIIPDEIIVFLSTLIITTFIILDYSNIYLHIVCAFAASFFLLSINLLTKGRGMGLGDVKLSVPIGLLLGFPYTPLWIFLSFILGAIVAIVLLMLKKAKRKDEIPFGPFLVAAFILVFLWGNTLLRLIVPL